MAFDIQVKIKRLDQGLPLPRYANPGDAGLDLYSAVDVVIEPMRRVMIPTGVAINEAVELVKKYGADDDYQFVNGLLGAVARERGEIPEPQC